MKVLLILFTSVCLLYANTAKAQSNTELDKLQSNSGYMLASGTVFTAAGIAFVGVGANYLRFGNQPISSVGGGVTGTTHGTRTGIIFVSTGGLLIGGGITLLVFGVKARHEYKMKKAALTVGCLDTGNVGLQAKF